MATRGSRLMLRALRDERDVGVLCSLGPDVVDPERTLPVEIDPHGLQRVQV